MRSSPFPGQRMDENEQRVTSTREPRLDVLNSRLKGLASPEWEDDIAIKIETQVYFILPPILYSRLLKQIETDQGFSLSTKFFQPAVLVFRNEQ